MDVEKLNKYIEDAGVAPQYVDAARFVIVFVLAFFVMKFIKYLIHKKARSLTKRTANDFDDLVINILDSLDFVFYGVVSAFVALQFVELQAKFYDIVEKVVLVVLAFYVVKALGAISNYFFKKTLKAQREKHEEYDPTVLKILNTSVKILLWILGVIFVIQNFGYDVSAILGGIGIAGVAIAFALQNILSDIFAFFSIYFDKPFKVGDFIVLGEGQMGTVQKIGIRSTRIKTLRGEELIVANEDLTSARINNFKKLEKRRQSFDLGVAYETSQAKLKKIPNLIEEAVENVDGVEFGRAHWKTFGDSALIFEVVYHVQDADYDKYMDVQQQINLGILAKFEKEKIEIAYPTQTLYIKK